MNILKQFAKLLNFVHMASVFLAFFLINIGTCEVINASFLVVKKNNRIVR